MDNALTGRSLAKATRRAALLDAAIRLFAERGFNGVSLEELGAAAGVSGPAVYRHFAGKQAVLGALLVGTSEELLAGSRAVAAQWTDGESADGDSADAAGCMRSLIRFQVDFALQRADLIRVQDRELASLAPGDLRTVRSLQRRYVELWVDVLGRLHPDRPVEELRNRAHAVFGLINSTPHTLRRDASAVDSSALGNLLESMAWAAVNARPPPSA